MPLLLSPKIQPHNNEMNYIADQDFGKVSYREKPLAKGEYENCRFRDCDFSECNLSDFVFTDCKFIYCNLSLVKLTGVDFSECDLTGSFFTDCDLDGAVFDNTNLEKADFSTAFNYSIDPERNKFKRTRFSSGGLKGLLNKYDIIIV